MQNSTDMLNPLHRNSDPSCSSPCAFTISRNPGLGILGSPLLMDMEEDYDQPLDMSKKSRTLSPESHANNHRHLNCSTSSSSSSSRSNTCSPESVYNNNNCFEFRQGSIFHNHQPSPVVNHSPSNNLNHHSHINAHSGNPHLQLRPSVITCASTLFGPRRSTSATSSSSSSSSSSSHYNHHSHPHHQTNCSSNHGKDEIVSYSSSTLPNHHHFHHHQTNSGQKTSPRPSSLASTSSSSSLSSSFSSSSSSCSSFRQSMKAQTPRQGSPNDAYTNNPIKKKIEGPNKMVILGEDSDSGIDEHFRRSLGKHYRSYSDVSMSVDDHFTKALGDTWLKLKLTKSQNGSKGSSYNNKNVPTVPS